MLNKPQNKRKNSVIPYFLYLYTMKKLVFLILCLLKLEVHAIQTIELSETAEISIVTCASGPISWQAYGHSAIRIQDTSNKIDQFYNYGTFDFHDPDFLVKFVRGKLKYFVSVNSPAEFVYEYQMEQRSVTAQILELTQQEKQDVFNFLVFNSMEENKYYLYDFVYENCCTKLRDIFSDKLQPLAVEGKPQPTIREMLDYYNKYNEWQDLGIDLLLGMRMDKKPDSTSQYFLPFDLENAFQMTPNLVKRETTLYEAETSTIQKIKPGPGMVFWILFSILLIVSIRRGNGFAFGKTGIFLTLFITGLLGIFLLFMWIGTDHGCTKWNLNVLWLCPLNFFVSLFIWNKNISKWVLDYIFIYRMVVILLLITFAWFPQQFHVATIPLMLSIVLIISSILPIKANYKLNM